MAKRKNYSNLLKQLQKEYAESHKDTNKSTINNDTTENSTVEDTSIKDTSTVDKSVSIDYDLDDILYAINDLSELKSIYTYCEEQMDKEQQITQDLLHAIEFSNNYKERYKYSTLLHYNRKRRRTYKTAIEVLKPLIEFIDKEDNKKCLNRLSNLLGDRRKFKERTKERVYTPRILDDLGEIKNEQM